jgi:hypothetical protein
LALPLAVPEDSALPHTTWPGLFAAPPAWLSGDLTEIFLLSQIVYQLLKEKLNL